MKRNLSRNSALCVLILALTSPVRAQDTHYWNQRYGTLSEFLAGAVVGSPVGLSSSFYNPGALALETNPQLFTTALAMEYNSLAFKPNRNEDSSLSWSSFGGAPSLIAGAFGRDTTKGRIYTYSYLTRQKFEFEITGRGIGSLEGLTPAPGDEHLSGQLNFRQSAEESWAGLTFSRRLKSGLGLGVTLYGAYRNQRTRNEFTAALVADSGQGASAIAITDFKFWDARALAKAGVMWEGGSWKAGVTYTSPSLHLVGDGSAYVHQSITGLDLDSNGTPDSRLLADYEENLSPTYKSPMSAAAGVSYHVKQTTLYASTEWFAKVSRYTVMEGSQVVSQVPGDTHQAVLVHEAISVVNWDLGVGQRLNAKTALYGGWALDRSAFKGDPNKSINVSNWNIYHVSFGSEFTFASVEITLGGTYSFGDHPFESKGDLETSSTSRELAADLTTGEARYRRIKLLLGFTLPIK
jgi:hypothetical protein